MVCNDIAQIGSGRPAKISGYLLRMSLFPKTMLLISNLVIEDNTDWSLSPILFQKLSQWFYIPLVDLFASRLNRQVATFVSWKPEQEAWVVDAFSINWKDIMFYAFPPFSVLG